MQSNGGLAEAQQFQGKDAILSGPAGGIVGAARTAGMAGLDRIIGFDMGGTSTDVALYDGAFERAFETEVAGVRMRAPMMAINTVAAGGGSILHFDGARVRVGPDSAGANPGAGLLPARRAAHGDRRQCLRRQDPARALSRRSSARRRRAARRRGGRRSRLRRARRRDGRRRPARGGRGLPARGRRQHGQRDQAGQRAEGPRRPRFALQCFGGAGGQHACLVADELGMETVFIHPYAGVLSAYGMGLADQAVLREQAVELPFSAAAVPELERVAARLAEAARAALLEQGADAGRVDGAPSVHLRYAGTEAALPVPLTRPGRDRRGVHRGAPGAVRLRHAGAALVVAELVAVEAVAAGEAVREPTLAGRATGGAPEPIDRWRCGAAGASTHARCSSGRRCAPATALPGPALVREANATTVVEPGWTAEVTRAGPHAAAPHRAAAEPRRRPAATGRTRCCSNCSTTCS